MSNPRNVGEAFRPPAGDLKVAPTSHVPFEAFYRPVSNYFVHDHKAGAWEWKATPSLQAGVENPPPVLWRLAGRLILRGVTTSDDRKKEYIEAYQAWQEQLLALHRVLLEGERIDPPRPKGLLNR